MNKMIIGATTTGTRPKIQNLAVFAVLVLLLVLPGCSTLNSGGSRTLKQTEMDVSWPMTRFRNGVAAGGVTLGEQEQVNSAYAGFEAAYREALQAANNNRNAPAPDNVKALATKVIAAVDSIPF
jgi:hypothetical protein